MQIWTRRRWPSDTLCIRHCRLMSNRSIKRSLLTTSTPSTENNNPAGEHISILQEWEVSQRFHMLDMYP